MGWIADGGTIPAMRAKTMDVAVAVAFLVASAVVWQRARVVSIALLVLGAAVVVIARQWRAPRVPKVPSDPALDQRAARYAVTQMLAQLTRVQVAYLSQAFTSESEGFQWLKQALPRSFRGTEQQLGADLERARHGEAPASLRLVSEIMDAKRRLAPLEQALEAEAATYLDHAIARPAVFVITDGIEVDDPDSIPLVVSVAGFNPTRQTIIPEVDALTVFVQDGKARRVVGQVAFASGDGSINRHLKCIGDSSGGRLFENKPVDDVAQLEVSLSPVPLGFLIGSSEFL